MRSIQFLSLTANLKKRYDAVRIYRYACSGSLSTNTSGNIKFKPTASINFDDHQSAFEVKPTRELMRGFFILKLCSFDLFVDNSLKMMVVAEKILGKRIFSACIRPTFYDQFVAGDDNKSMATTIARLQNSQILPMIACMMEDEVTDASVKKREENYRNNAERILNCLQLLSSMSDRACLQVKITGLMSPNLLVKVANVSRDGNAQKSLAQTFSEAMTNGNLKRTEYLKTFADNEVTSLELALRRFARIGTTAAKIGVRVLVDAEFVSFNDGINTIALGMMAAYNQQTAHVWCTVQCYLANAVDNVSNLMKISSALNASFGVKIVRGAYMAQEKELAAKNKYSDPINSTYEATGVMYNRVVDLMLRHISTVDSRCNIVIATHNERAIYAALKRISELNLDLKSRQINFAQLYGMCDQVTNPLAQAGVNVYKSIPYGTVSETLPYLYRRATENRSIMKGARKEREMLWSELKNRFKGALKLI